MTNTEAKLIQELINNENMKKAVEIAAFFTMLHYLDGCGDAIVKDVNAYVEVISILHEKCKGLPVYKIQKKSNPIESADFAKFTKFHVEINELMKIYNERMN